MAETVTEEREVQTLDIRNEARIDAPIEIVFQSMLDELGPEGQMPGGKPLPMKLEPWPGGRWYRDLGDNTGHLWGHVQVIKPPKLIEITGPCFLSFPATNHIQYRLIAEGDATRLKVTNRAFGYMPKRYMEGAEQGWEHGFKKIAEIAARLKKDQQKSAKR